MVRPVLYVIVLEALCREVRSGCPEELLYADDLALVSESLETGKLESTIVGWNCTAAARYIDNFCM